MPAENGLVPARACSCCILHDSFCMCLSSFQCGELQELCCLDHLPHLINWCKVQRKMGDKPMDGMLKVTVVQGKKLAIRDFTSSDPYVILKLGNQTAKTKVINSCLNPVWNEEFTFTITDHLGVLNLEVFDKDRFKSDDKMGHAYHNLQAIETSSRLRHVLQASAGETRLRKMVPSDDNCLVRESFVRCVDGEIVQDVWLKLLDVESGELELKIRWVDRS